MTTTQLRKGGRFFFYATLFVWAVVQLQSPEFHKPLSFVSLGDGLTLRIVAFAAGAMALAALFH